MKSCYACHCLLPDGMGIDWDHGMTFCKACSDRISGADQYPDTCSGCKTPIKDNDKTTDNPAIAEDGGHWLIVYRRRKRDPMIYCPECVAIAVAAEVVCHFDKEANKADVVREMMHEVRHDVF